MKNVTIKNKQGQIISDQNIYKDPTEFINHIVSTNYWGKPICWVRAKIEKITHLSDNPEEDASVIDIIFPDERYDESDVLEIEEKATGNIILDDEGEPIQIDGIIQRLYDKREKILSKYKLTSKEELEFYHG